ncbi:DUF4339 domain-containing protein, partial [Myxococcota bacterium]
MCEWLVRIPGRSPMGPVTTELLVRDVGAGRIPRDTEVCKVGDTAWQPLSAVEQLRKTAGPGNHRTTGPHSGLGQSSAEGGQLCTADTRSGPRVSSPAPQSRGTRGNEFTEFLRTSPLVIRPSSQPRAAAQPPSATAHPVRQPAPARSSAPEKTPAVQISNTVAIQTSCACLLDADEGDDETGSLSTKAKERFPNLRPWVADVQPRAWGPRPPPPPV